MAETSAAQRELESVIWGPVPDAPVIASFALHNNVLGHQIDIPGADITRSDLVRMGFHIGALRHGEPQEIERGSRAWGLAQRFARSLRNADNLECYAAATVDQAYIDHERWVAERTDSMTNLPNRRRWLEDTILAYKWVNGPLGKGEEGTERGLVFCFSDVDGFKRVNDDVSHPVGNSVLARFGALFSKLAHRKGRGGVAADLAVRFHGDEFGSNRRVTAGQGQDIEEIAREIAGRFQRSLDQNMGPLNAFIAQMKKARDAEELARANAAREVADISPHPVVIGASVGYAILRRGDRIEDFIDRADKAMYAAKKARKDAIAVEDARLLTDEERGLLVASVEALDRLPGQRSLATGLGSFVKVIVGRPFV